MSAAADTSTIDNGLAARLSSLIVSQLPYRHLSVPISRADERRIVAFIEAFNDATPDEPMNPNHDDDLALVVSSCMGRGLSDDEADRREWSDRDGRSWSLPRPVRAPVMMRARIAWRAARVAWRAT